MLYEHGFQQLCYHQHFLHALLQKLHIKIESDQIKYTVDKNEKIIDGNKEVSELIKDKWVLERDISSNNPNWKLVETDVVNE